MSIKSFARRIVYRWIRDRDVKIRAGVGKGLRFNAGPSNLAYALGTNEPPVQNALERFLEPGDVFFDVGANVGFFSVIGAKLVGETGRVYIFEPVPDNMEMVKHNCELNGFSNLTYFDYAVSNSTGEADLLLAEYSGGATLSSDDTPPDLKGTLLVKLVSLDEMVFNRGVAPPSLVKIDVEGAESNVLHGMHRTITEFKPVIIFEVDDQDQDRFDQKLEDCSTFLELQNYDITRLDDSYIGSGWLVGNFVAVPKHKKTQE
jgi:FkbM family methyltransferase